MKTENIVNEVISLAGGQSKLAFKMSVSPQVVQSWAARGYFPLKRIPEVVKNFPEFSYEELVCAATD